MESTVILVLLAFFGLFFGSFAGAQVWRLRSHQLTEEMGDGELVDEQEYERLQPLASSTIASDRSRCLHCHTVLAWYDLVPLLSWVSTKGRCRYCKAPIGLFEPMMELGTAAAFVVLYVFWPAPLDSPLEVGKFLIWLVASVIFAIQFATDFKWRILWTMLNLALIVLGVAYTALVVVGSDDSGAALMSALGAVAALGGLYFVLYAVSRERWVGLGDAYLGTGLGLLLADWRLALLALFLANLIGSLVVLPGMISGKLSRKAHVPFGPLLILGATIALLAGRYIVDWYISLLF